MKSDRHTVCSKVKPNQSSSLSGSSLGVRDALGTAAAVRTVESLCTRFYWYNNCSADIIYLSNSKIRKFADHFCRRFSYKLHFRLFNTNFRNKKLRNSNVLHLLRVPNESDHILLFTDRKPCHYSRAQSQRTGYYYCSYNFYWIWIEFYYYYNFFFRQRKWMSNP